MGVLTTESTEFFSIEDFFLLQLELPTPPCTSNPPTIWDLGWGANFDDFRGNLENSCFWIFDRVTRTMSIRTLLSTKHIYRLGNIVFFENNMFFRRNSCMQTSQQITKYPQNHRISSQNAQKSKNFEKIKKSKFWNRNPGLIFRSESILWTRFGEFGDFYVFRTSFLAQSTVIILVFCLSTGSWRNLLKTFQHFQILWKMFLILRPPSRPDSLWRWRTSRYVSEIHLFRDVSGCLLM